MNKIQIEINEKFSKNIIDYFEFMINNECYLLNFFIINILIAI